MPRALERLKPERTQLIFRAADNFIEQKTN
jgi:hypothetical protein